MKRYYLFIALFVLLTAMCLSCTNTPAQAPDSNNSSASTNDTTHPTTPTQTSTTLPATTTIAPVTTTTAPVTTTAKPVTTTTAPVTTTAKPVTTTTAPVTTTTKPVTTTTAPVTTTTKPVTTTTAPVTTTTKPVTTTTAPVTTTEPVTERPSTLVTPETEPSQNALVKVNDYIPSLYVDLRYAGKNNLADTVIYDYSDAYLRYGTVRRLAAVQEDLLEDGYSLLIWDAYRPLSAQFTLSVVLPNKATSPVSMTVPYNAGDTLSLSIVKTDGSSVAVPYDFDHDTLPATHDNSSSAKANAQRLADAMHAHGFVNYLDDWYRFTDKDRYGIDHSLTVSEEGIEESPEWVTVCNQSLTLRAEPNTTAAALALLPRGLKVKVIYFVADFAYIEANGKRGYVLAAYLSRTEEGLYQSDLEVIEPCENYSYDQMQSDLRELAEKFPDQLRLSSIGESEEGRELTLAIMGNENAEKRVFLQSTIHAREYIVTEITLAQMDYMLHHQSEYLPNSRLTIGELLDKVCFHIVPMSNPDGVAIVQSGKIPSSFAGRVTADKALIWKANAKGIDLNANFDARWENYGSTSYLPDYMGYKGSSPECAAESKALADYLRANEFDLILSYHTSGSVIYWSFGGAECQAVNDQNYDLARKLAVVSDFTVNMQIGTSTAGLKDWAIETLKTPSLTIEFAAATSPVMLREFDQIWARGRDMLSLCGEWVLDQ